MGAFFIMDLLLQPCTQEVGGMLHTM